MFWQKVMYITMVWIKINPTWGCLQGKRVSDQVARSGFCGGRYQRWPHEEEIPNMALSPGTSSDSALSLVWEVLLLPTLLYLQTCTNFKSPIRSWMSLFMCRDRLLVFLPIEEESWQINWESKKWSRYQITITCYCRSAQSRFGPNRKSPVFLFQFEYLFYYFTDFSEIAW